MKKKILCVCGAGFNRSRYLASYLKTKGYFTKFGGLDEPIKKGKTNNLISQEEVDWADIIILVRKRLKQKLSKDFKTKHKRVIVLDVTDSRGLLPKEFEYLKEASREEFDKFWMKPQLRNQIKKYFPL